MLRLYCQLHTTACAPQAQDSSRATCISSLLKRRGAGGEIDTRGLGMISSVSGLLLCPVQSSPVQFSPSIHPSISASPNFFRASSGQTVISITLPQDTSYCTSRGYRQLSQGWADATSIEGFIIAASCLLPQRNLAIIPSVGQRAGAASIASASTQDPSCSGLFCLALLCRCRVYFNRNQSLNAPVVV